MLFGLGCSFKEQSVALKPTDSVALSLHEMPAERQVNTRQWLRDAHQQIRHLLPASKRPPMLTEQLVDHHGRAADVFRHFGVSAASLHKLVGNFNGLRLTAQSMSKDYYIESVPPSWPGFEDVWVPINPRLSLAGRLGFARRGGVVSDATCIILQPALFGDNGVLRTRDIATALRECGYHVLSIESRAHGQTEARYPDVYSTWGILEADDLLVVADWAMRLPHVQRTGLIGYCWGANIALLTAWHEARRGRDPLVSEVIKPYFSSEATAPPRFTAGIMAFSPIVRYEEFMDDLETPRTMLDDPVYASIQQTIRDRMVRKGYPNPSGSMRKLIQYEYERYGVRVPKGTEEGTPFVRLLPYRGQPCGDKLEAARVPTLIVHAADDPVGPAQDVAQLIAQTDNPNVAAIVLASGGHVGFAGYAKAYYLSLVTNFFDPVRGAAAAGAIRPALSRVHDSRPVHQGCSGFGEPAPASRRGSAAAAEPA